MSFKITVTYVVFLLIVVLVPQLSAAAIETEMTDTITTDTEYTLGSQDLLTVQVFRAEDYEVTVRINSKGDISLPLIGKVRAEGLTVPELEDFLAFKLGKEYFQNPQVSVFVKEFTSQRVTIEGSVKQPGIYPLKGRTSLLQAIALAQGLDDLADRSNIQVYHNNAGTRAQAVYNINSIRAGEIPDPLVRSDDVIVVHRSEARSFVKGITDTLRGFISFGTVPIN